MSTTDELLEEMLEDAEEYATPVTDDDLQFWIDEHLRVISIPKNGVVAGVEGDKNVNKIKFGMNRYYHGFDMSTFSGRILYSNAKGNKNYYNITDMQASGSAITFSWLVDADAVQYMGKTAFVVYLFKTQGSELRQKFYSTLATLKVLEGMEVDSAVPVEKQTDIIERMKEEISAYAEEVKKSLPADYTAMTEQVSSLKEDLDKFNPLLSYVDVDAKVLSGVKNRFDIENIADTGFHVSINVKSGEKYLINGSGFNNNYPLYVICSDNAVIGYSDDTTYSYKSGVEIKIPNGATKFYVNGKNEYHPLIKKLVYDNHKETIEEKSYDIHLNVEHLLYHSEFENLTNDSGYSALISVTENDKYLLTGSGTGQYPSYIFYDKNMSIVLFGESSVIVDKLVIIPSNVAYLRIQNNLGTLLKAIKYIEKNIIFIGDSYTQGNSLGNDQDKRFSTILSEMLRMKEINVGAGGCGYFKTENYPTYFYQQLINAINTMSAKDWANTEYILVCGGRNDPNNYPNATQAEYDKATSDICDMASKYFPCAKLVFVPYLFDSNYMPNNYYKHYLKLVNALRKNKCAVINYAYTWLTGRFADILEDKVHPNVNGHNIIAHNLYNILIGGNIINSQSVRLMGMSEYTPGWTYIDCMLLGTDALNIFGNFTISENVPAQTIILEHTFEENDIYTAYTGRTSFSLLISNLSTGISYSVFLKYENGKIRLYANTTIPKGNYFISYTMPFGRL